MLYFGLTHFLHTSVDQANVVLKKAEKAKFVDCVWPLNLWPFDLPHQLMQSTLFIIIIFTSVRMYFSIAFDGIENPKKK